MKNLNRLNELRNTSQSVQDFYGSLGDDKSGVFVVKSPIDRKPMNIVASAGLGWDHISVSRQKRPPNWTELEHVKRLFFEDDEIAMQLHVPSANHVNLHNNCLHLWRPHNAEIPMPPMFMV